MELQVLILLDKIQQEEIILQFLKQMIVHRKMSRIWVTLMSESPQILLMTSAV